jgi:hypothetical protein
MANKIKDLPDKSVPSMKAIIFFAWMYIFIVPVTFGFLDKVGIMTASILAGCLILAFAYIDKVKKIKGAGFEAEMREAINEAYATIEKLQDIAVKLSEPIVTEVTMHNRMMQYIPLKYRFEQIKEIESSLHNLGVAKEKIDKTTEFFYSVYREDHIKKIVYAIAQDKDAPDALQEKLEKYKEGEIPVKFHMAQFISDSEYVPNHEVEELIKDSEHYEQERNFRRIDTWQ